MPITKVQLQCDLENLTDLQYEDTGFKLYLRCQCGEEIKTPQYIDSKEEVQIARATVNYAVKCKLCSKKSTIKYIEDKKNPSQKVKQLNINT